MDLSKALRLTRRTRAALVGAGGKTTALFQLARAFDPPVVVTTSTHLGEWQREFADHHFMITRPEDIMKYVGQIEGVTLFTGIQNGEQRLSGLDTTSLEVLRELAEQLKFPVLIEADGSRQKPLKAPAAHEPAIPQWANQVIVFAGLSGLWKPLDEKTVHRAELFGQLSGIGQGRLIEEDGLARLLTNRQGGLKNIPMTAKKSLILNQADDEDLILAGMRIANSVKTVYNTTLISNLSKQKILSRIEPTAGIILAAGASNRFGAPKVLLQWQGKALIRHNAEAALSANLDPVIVVLGAVHEPIKDELKGLPVHFIENPNWSAGQSTSVQKGILALPNDIGAVIFLLADQPTVTSEVINALVSDHQKTQGAIIAPQVDGKRTNPVLFDQETFPSLMQIKGDTGGRALFDKFPVNFLKWDDKRLLLDVDTPEDYKKLQGIG